MPVTFAVTMPGGPEWLVILAIVVLLFGAKKLPELGGSVGKSIKEFKKGVEEGKSAEADAVAAESADSEPKPAPTEQ